MNMAFLQTRSRSLLESRYSWWILGGLAVVLRLRQYLANRSFWADEVALALNIVDRSFIGLTQELSNQAYAPIGFLFIEKAVLSVLGNRDYILRLVPLISGMLAIYFMIQIAKEQLGAAGLLACLLFAVSWPLIYYSSELKQYSSDVVIALVLVYYASRCLRLAVPLRDVMGLGILGLIAIWLSYPSIFILASIGVALLLERLAKRTDIPAVWLVALGGTWLLDFSAEYLVSLQGAAGNPYLQSFWQPYFMPLPPWGRAIWFILTYRRLLGFSLGIGLDSSAALLAVCGLMIVGGGIWLFTKARGFALLVLLPFAFALFASGIGQYPIYERLILFLVPFIFLLISGGLREAWSLAGPRYPVAAVVFCGLAVAFVAWQPLAVAISYFRTPYRSEDIKPALSYVRTRIGPDDLIYVYSGNGAFQYYSPSYGLQDRRISVEDWGQGAFTALQQDMDRLPGDRVWFLFTHTGEERDSVIKYLNRHGRVLDKFFSPGVYVYLYELDR